MTSSTTSLHPQSAKMRPTNFQGQCSILFLPSTIHSSWQTVPAVENWRRLTQDSWFLNTIQGYKTAFLTVSKEEAACILDEVKSLLEKSAILIHPTHESEFLSFRWKGKTYHFTCLPLSSSVPHPFTKVMKPVIAFLKSLGI